MPHSEAVVLSVRPRPSPRHRLDKHRGITPSSAVIDGGGLDSRRMVILAVPVCIAGQDFPEPS